MKQKSVFKLHIICSRCIRTQKRKQSATCVRKSLNRKDMLESMSRTSMLRKKEFVNFAQKLFHS